MSMEKPHCVCCLDQSLSRTEGNVTPTNVEAESRHLRSTFAQSDGDIDIYTARYHGQLSLIRRMYYS